MFDFLSDYFICIMVIMNKYFDVVVVGWVVWGGNIGWVSIIYCFGFKYYYWCWYKFVDKVYYNVICG